MKAFRYKVWICFLVLISLLVGCTPVSDQQENEGTKPAPKILESGVQEIGGVVIGGGDTTPEDLLDGPRVFVYQLKLDSGEEISVTYTSFPPSPAGDSKPKIELSFHAGVIEVGDYVEAWGTYDQSTKILTVMTDGDYIRTFETKP